MSPWIPVLSESPDMKTAAWKSIEAISSELLQQRYLSDHLQRKHYVYEEALLYGYLYCANLSGQWNLHCIERLNMAIDGSSELDLSLYGGLCGLGWTIEHISRLLLNSGYSQRSNEEHDLNEDIDVTILKQLENEPGVYPYDLISGLVGFGVYFLERLPHPLAQKGLALIIEQISEAAECNDAGATWLTAPQFLPSWQRSEFPFGHYDLGVAHGVPGILYLLCEIMRRGFKKERTLDLLEKGVRWLHSQARADGARSLFPPWTSPVPGSYQARPVWCYGDLGIAAVLLQVARYTDRSDWRSLARDLIQHCLDLAPEQYLVRDAGLCHGSSGIAHMFNRFYHMENNPRYRAAALFWFQRTLDFCQSGSGFGGYSRFTTENSSKNTNWEPSPGFLDGAIGIALSLLGAVTSVEPKWDRLLLLSGSSQWVPEPQ